MKYLFPFYNFYLLVLTESKSSKDFRREFERHFFSFTSGKIFSHSQMNFFAISILAIKEEMGSARARQAGRLRQYFGHKCAHKFAKKIHRYIYFTSLL